MARRVRAAPRVTQGVVISLFLKNRVFQASVRLLAPLAGLVPHPEVPP
jgi:hypothetical protein